MLSIERTKKILGKPEMSDEEAELFRDDAQSIAEIIIGAYIRQEVSSELREKLKYEIE